MSWTCSKWIWSHRKWFSDLEEKLERTVSFSQNEIGWEFRRLKETTPSSDRRCGPGTITEAVIKPELLDMGPPSCVCDAEENLSGSMCSLPLIPALAARLPPIPHPFSSIPKACVSSESKCEVHGRRIISFTPSSRNSGISWRNRPPPYRPSGAGVSLDTLIQKM